MDGNYPVFDARHLQVLPKQDLMKLLIKFTYEVYIKKLPRDQIKPWTPNQSHSIMEHYLDMAMLGQPTLPADINSVIIQSAIDGNRTVAELVWTAIAIRITTMPLMCTSCQRAINNSEDDEYVWSLPVSQN